MNDVLTHRECRRLDFVAGAVLLALAVWSCEGRKLPLPRFPQVEQATEAVQGGGERYRVHRACTSAAQSIDGLTGCMRDAGWEFVARGPGYPEAECWRARDRDEIDRIQPECFLRTREPARGAAP